MFTAGRLLAQRYRLTRRIAVGGMGEVWEATDTRLSRPVAVKLLKPELCGDPAFLHRFRTEARTTAALNHPGIAGVHDYGETAALPDGAHDTAYLVMELVDGVPLASLLSRLGRLTVEQTMDVLEQAGQALNAAHEHGYVHRDVKPGNIIIASTGAVKLTDFGIAKAVNAAPTTQSGLVMGTAHYIAPEQALGNEAEPASDVYSLAVVGYECLAGHRPFHSESAVAVAMMHIRDLPPPLPPDTPPDMRTLIEASLVKDPRRRYQCGGEFAAAVTAIRAGRPLPIPVQRGPRPNPTSMSWPVPNPRIPSLQPSQAQAGPETGMIPGMTMPNRSHRGTLWTLVIMLVLITITITIMAIVMVTRPHPRSVSLTGAGPSGQHTLSITLPRDTVTRAFTAVPIEAGDLAYPVTKGVTPDADTAIGTVVPVLPAPPWDAR